jgi:AraC family transcriptional regulator of adaptative response / DNA-3-methyladenine glycosylase II
MSATHPGTLDPRVCEGARLARDARFDGLFFIAVTSTGIFCRPICPARSPRRENVRYYASAAQASAAGFRPCLRCRPEAAPGSPAWDRAGDLVSRALRRIEDGCLDQGGVPALARSLAIGERQLRRLFVDRIGATPIEVDSTRRVLFAKKLLGETHLPVTQIAFASGFRSVRRFNTAFRDTYRRAPRDIRRSESMPRGPGLRLALAYRPPYDFPAMLAFLGRRAVPGVESVENETYSRTIALPEGGGRIAVRTGKAPNTLELTVDAPSSAALARVATRVRRLFDLDANPAPINAALGADPLLRERVRHHPGQRVPGCWDGFELAVRALLGQQVSVAAARTFATRLVAAHGSTVDGEAGARAFPTPQRLADADLRVVGLTTRRAASLQALARAAGDGAVQFDGGQDLDTFVAALCELDGIGPWTAHYIAMRALHHPDAFPAADLVLRQVAGSTCRPLSAAALSARAEAWRPWRAYAVLHLWGMAA